MAAPFCREGGDRSEYAATLADAMAEEAEWRAYELERERWLELHAPKLAGTGPRHECSIVVPDEDDPIAFEEFSGNGEICGACGRGTFAFGTAAFVISSTSGRATDDPWVTAVVDALSRERSWVGDGRRQILVVALGQGEMFHLTAAKNRESILLHGLDWQQMGDRGGIAGSRSPELSAIFLCENREETSFFLNMARWACDLWAVRVAGLWLENGPSGWVIVPQVITPDRIRLVETDIPSARP